MPEETKYSANSKPKFWNDPEKRALLFQVLMVGTVILFILYIVSNTLSNLETRGISTGFDFLSQTAGFDILLTLIPYDATYSFGRTFVVGLMNTMLVSFLGVVLATLLGFIVGIARLSHNWLIAKMAAIYVEVFRNIPLLLQIFFWYFAVLQVLPSPRQSIELFGGVQLNVRGLYLPEPVAGNGFGWVVLAFVAALILSFFLVRWAKKRQDQTGQYFPAYWASIGLVLGMSGLTFLLAGSPITWVDPELVGFNFKGGITIIPELSALLLALSIYTAAFIAEIVRSGIEAVDHGQTEAASALGLPRSRVLRLVVIPQAMRVVIPPLTSQYLNLIKNSSLATAIGYPDLVSVFAGTTLNQTGQAIEVIAMTMGVYLLLSLLVSLFMNWYNKRVALVER
ncbi:amino acid ABC transporter permease [Aestuariirhabdus litorea]|uniref:Amino acid ABC transporter permease n=1 Tax=Aestuariirhabdus litorea TaxID=2528527 RepID=A0A3P3VM83_9GAMM|nr:amino acid ABC transporter permease [Aestuariirhabdus litorea]RRJ83740.1 amino acid ABC transporter permease [Aestuariirhabdus litorea]RWW96963.1 ABC transporter permease subunit [Endozoicomonadaceae bacterium GTF-13]